MGHHQGHSIDTIQLCTTPLLLMLLHEYDDARYSLFVFVLHNSNLLAVPGMQQTAPKTHQVVLCLGTETSYKKQVPRPVLSGLVCVSSACCAQIKSQLCTTETCSPPPYKPTSIRPAPQAALSNTSASAVGRMRTSLPACVSSDAAAAASAPNGRETSEWRAEASFAL